MRQHNFVSRTVLGLVVTFALIAAPSAASAASGGISGTVTASAGGAGIGGIEVCLYGGYGEVPVIAGGEPGEAPPCATTEASGKYTITGLSAGLYEVDFRAPSQSALDYLPQFYPEADSYAEAEPVMVNGSSTRAGIDAVLRAGARLSGRVEDAVSETGLEDIQVCVYETESSGIGNQGCVETGADGSYSIAGLAGGDYKVGFWPGKANYIQQYYEGNPTFEAATTVHVPATGLTAGIDARLQRGAKVSGTVLGADTHAPIEGVGVCAQIQTSVQYICGETDAAGSYSIEGLPAGEAKLWFTGPGEYASQYSAPFVLGAGATKSGVDVELQPGGEITGTLTNAATEGPLEAVEACAIGTTAGTSPERCAESGTDGGYAIGPLASGDYKVEFLSAYESGSYYGGGTFEAATAISVHTGSTTHGIDGRIHEGSEIAGTVTDAAGAAPIEDVEVCASAGVNGYIDRCAITGPAGTYSIAGLSEGEYRVSFEAVGRTSSGSTTPAGRNTVPPRGSMSAPTNGAAGSTRR